MDEPCERGGAEGLEKTQFFGEAALRNDDEMKKLNPTLLVVDDSEDDQFLIKYAFKKIGVTDPIHLLSDGAEAIAYMMGEGKYADRKKFAYPTFIMTDLKMPRRDGFAVLEFLKGNPEWAVIPTIVFSASYDTDDI